MNIKSINNTINLSEAAAADKKAGQTPVPKMNPFTS